MLNYSIGELEMDAFKIMSLQLPIERTSEPIQGANMGHLLFKHSVNGLWCSLVHSLQ